MADLTIDYIPEQHRAVLHTTSDASGSGWYHQLKRALEDQTDHIEEPKAGIISAPWWAFVLIREEIGALLRTAGVSYSVSDTALVFLRRAAARKQSLASAVSVEQPSQAEVQKNLVSRGWNWAERPLTPEQMRNVCKLVALPAAATFSVPGAGKTTEALAYFMLRATPGQHLMVVAPKNAFGAWDEQFAICIGGDAPAFVRLRGGWDSIAAMLSTAPRLMLITYQQLARVTDLVAQFISEHESFVYLDESHKIKSGRGRPTPDAVLAIAHLPSAKLIMSGTPMPQSADDLVPQFEFLYPEVRVTENDVVARIQPVFVRTTKSELNLPAVNRNLIPVPFNPSQKRLYDLMRSEAARQAEQALSQGSRSALRRLGRSVMRLLEIVSNPSLLARDITFLHDELLGEVLAEGAAPKIKFACERARRLAKKGQKVIIWTTFRQNVESICDQLRDIGAVFIHGGIDAGSEDDDGKREGRIRQFRYDPNCFVMVANPAAAGEGISLHKVCHHAIYVDRTYNAAHYLQSEDRIHRLGLLPDESPTVEILQCPGSIDENVQTRLELKVTAMANALNDRSLSIGANQFIPFDADDDPESESENLDEDDIESILQWLRSGG
jgi:hypothetical protein